MRHQLVRDAEQNLSDVLLLTDGQVLPQLMGRNPVVGLEWRDGCGSSGMDSPRG